MDKELLDKWEQIYSFANEIAGMNPWEIFDEKDILALIPRGTQEEHYFSFIGKHSDETAIAIYSGANAYSHARSRLNGSNPRKEPVFLLQDAIVFRFGDREDVSKTNYNIIKSLNIPCRGRGCWPFFQRYRVGYMPDDVPLDQLDALLDDMGNLMMMVRAVTENHLENRLGQGEVLLRTYSAESDMFYTGFTPVGPVPKPRYTEITMTENEWLQNIRVKIPRGTIELDWSYLPTVVRDGKEKIVPRLVLAVDARSGIIQKGTLLPPSKEPYDDVLTILEEIIDEFGKPSAIEVCDDELETYLSDVCKKTGIRLVRKKKLKQLTLARNEFLRSGMTM